MSRREGRRPDGGRATALRDLLRSQRVFPAGMPEFDPVVAPDDPVTLFPRWLEVAIQDEVPAPRAVTLATADDQGDPRRAC